MKQSYLNTYEELLKQSLMVPELVSKSANKDSSFLIDINRWLIDTERIMKENNIAKCSQIAGLRSKIVAQNFAPDSKISKRKQHFSVATSIIDEAQDSVLSVLEPIQNRIEEARAAIRQLLGVAYQANMINPNEEFNQMVKKLWSTFSSHEQLKGAIASILVLVNQSDALRILADEIDFSMLRSDY